MNQTTVPVGSRDRITIPAKFVRELFEDSHLYCEQVVRYTLKRSPNKVFIAKANEVPRGAQNVRKVTIDRCDNVCIGVGQAIEDGILPSHRDPLINLQRGKIHIT